MNTARNDVLHAIRRALGRDATSVAPKPEPPPRPQVDANLAQRFAQKLRDVDGTVDFADNDADVAAKVDAYLAQHNIQRNAVLAPDERMKKIPWPTQWQTAHRNARAGDNLSITPAFAAVAETGSVVLTAAAQTPAALNLLPPTHIVIVEEKQIVPCMEDVWTLLRAANQTSRAVFFITGPSRTADIEQTLQLGAHGPTRFHVVVRR